MHDVVQDSALGQRVELILQQVDSLPTLSPIAIRILELAGSSETAIDEIVRLIESDPSLSVKLLTLCRRADRGLGAAVQTVERAVVLLGLDAVRAAVLSFEVFEAIESRTEEEEALASAAAESEQSSYKRKNLWRYLIAIACAAELLAERHQYEQHVNPEEAFLCGLLSGLGMLALDRVLPRSFAKAAAVAERKQRNIDAIEKQLLGMDHHTAGKRLAEHWKLPHVLQDCMWLVGQHPSALPELPHWHMVALVTAAAEIARSQHIGWSGNFTPSSDIHAIASAAGLDARGMDQTIRVLPERVADRAQLIGLDDVEDRELLLESVMAANKKLGRLAELFDERSRRAERHAKVIESISRFNAYS
ncbi:MAG: HDOD domain-containing protein, partial [Planctomycetota bacterium]